MSYPARIIAEMADRVRLEMERKGISKNEAMLILANDDEERRKWGLYVFGEDTWDPALYDLVLHVKKLTSDDAVDLICHTVELEHFQATRESQQILDDLTMAAGVKAALIVLKPDVEVSAKKGLVCVRIKRAELREEWRIRKLAQAVPGVEDVDIRAQEISLKP